MSTREPRSTISWVLDICFRFLCCNVLAFCRIKPGPTEYQQYRDGANEVRAGAPPPGGREYHYRSARKSRCDEVQSYEPFPSNGPPLGSDAAGGFRAGGV